MNITVPNEITEELKLLLSKINSQEKPVYVICKYNNNDPKNECFPLVEAKVKAEGGERILGWQVWQEELIVEAEFHAVWKTPLGEFLDITPKEQHCDRILFVPDSTVIYEGKQVNNIRINITGNSLVDEFISVCDAIFYIENKEERALQYELILEDKEADIYEKLNSAKLMLNYMSLQGFTKNTFCLCGSGKKYKSCHSKMIKTLISQCKS